MRKFALRFLALVLFGRLKMVYWLDGRDLPLKDILPRRPRYFVSASRDEELRELVRAVKNLASNVRSAAIKGDYLQWLTSAREYVEWVVWVSRRYALWSYEDKVQDFTTCTQVFAWLDGIQTKWTARISKETYDIARQRYNASLPIGTVSPPSSPIRATPKTSERDNDVNDVNAISTAPVTQPPSSAKKAPKGSKRGHRRHSSTPCATAPRLSPDEQKSAAKPRRRSTHPVIQPSSTEPASLSAEEEPPKETSPTTPRSIEEQPPLDPSSSSLPITLEKKKSLRPPKPVHDNLSRRKSRMVLRMPGYRVVSEMVEDNEVLVLKLLGHGNDPTNRTG